MNAEPTPIPQESKPAAERPVREVRGTRVRLPTDYADLAEIEATLLDRFARAGYAPMRIPVLDHTDLHERKSGAGIVSKLYELAGGGPGVCLRPELTAGVVRAYVEAGEPPPLPWRVSVSGPVFRHEAMRPGFDREFHQVGVEMLGAGGPGADAEAIWLAWWALGELGLRDASVRIGHVGLILELFERSGLPEAARAALVERLSEAASEGHGVASLEAALAGLADWLGGDGGGPAPSAPGDDPAVDRLFRTLVPDVTGRRSGREVVARLRRKWDLGHSLLDAIRKLREEVRSLAALRGPIARVLPQLEFCYEELAPESVASLRELAARLDDYGVDLDRVELDLGFGRGIGFYSRMVFELTVASGGEAIEVGGGGRYDGLARVLGGEGDDRGVGFAFGTERLWLALGQIAPPRPGPSPIRVLAETPESTRHAIRLATQLRQAGYAAVLGEERSFRAWRGASEAHAEGLCALVRGDGAVVIAGSWDEAEAVVTVEELMRRIERTARAEATP